MVGVGGGGNSNSIGNGPGFESPRGIAEEADGSLVVVDSDLDAVLRVDPTTGDRVIISDASIGSGQVFELPLSIAIEADGSLVVVDTGLECGATGGSYQRRPSDCIDYRQWPITQLANA